MASLPVLADTFQAVLHWRSTVGRTTPVNVLHFRRVVAGTGTTANLAAALNAAMVANTGMWGFLSQDYTLDHLTITPLDGVTAGLDFAATSGIAGLAAGQAIMEGSALMSFKTVLRGPAGRGRCYIGPITEGYQSDGVLDTATVTTTGANWANFRTNLGAASPAWTQVIVHNGALSVPPTTSVANNVVSSSCRPWVATQRRRLTRQR